LKTLGFTKPQLGAVVACQATVAVTLGLLIGVPLGIVAGRYLWDLFANSIHAVPSPTVSAIAVALITLGAIVLANLVSLVPGRAAARTSVGTLLRAD
jgi:predicted lysophospholipase L1 biosynthesis ABC-type transport system permease subunit